MITLTNETEVLQVLEIEEFTDFVILYWGQYQRMMTIEDFNNYTII